MIRHPERACRAKRYAPWVDQVRIDYRCLAFNVRDEIRLQIYIRGGLRVNCESTNQRREHDSRFIHRFHCYEVLTKQLLPIFFFSLWWICKNPANVSKLSILEYLKGAVAVSRTEMRGKRS